MKKPNKKTLSLMKETLRALRPIELIQVGGAIGGTVGGNGHPYTCTCPNQE